MGNLIILFTLVLLTGLADCGVQVRSGLHEVMSEDQLMKYFGVRDKKQVPEYEVVTISVKKRSHINDDDHDDHNVVRRGGGRQPIDDEGGDGTMFIDSLFGRSFRLGLFKNPHLVAPGFRALMTDKDGAELDISPPFSSMPRLCHFLGSNGSVVAAVSDCGSTGSPGLRGILLLPDRGLQIEPLSDDLIPHWKRSQEPDHNSEESIFNHPHIVSVPTRSKKLSVVDEWEDEHYIPANPREDYEIDESDILSHLNSDFDDLNTISDDVPRDSNGKILEEEIPDKRSSSKPLYLELGLFFDEMAYNMFMPHVKTEDNLINLLLGFVNQLQAIYHQSMLKRKIQISLVHLELMKKQPKSLPHADGERDKLLDSFCSYQAKKNPSSDKDPNHWDVALYISGLNFFSMENGEKNGVTMGLAPVGGVCLAQHSCVIAEFGTVSDEGKPYPSAGLLSTYVAVHEIGHNLGMYHDGPPNNNCPTNGHVMSPSRGTKGETTWSSCSADVLKKLKKDCLLDSPSPMEKGRDHTKYDELPGQTWDSHEQCQIFLRDEDATLLNDTVISMICEQTLCKTPHRIGYYAAGPALEGTYCGGEKWCQQGQCVSWGSKKPKVVKGKWSDWRKGECKSGCIEKAKGTVMDKRYCNDPKPRNTEKMCEGDNIRVSFCDDKKMCKKRKVPAAYASGRCKEFMKYLPDVTPLGVQVKHNEKRQWQACAVYCKMKSGTWYTPRQELNDRGIDTFFPDGTWCHNSGKADFYCQNHLCLPPQPKGRSLNPFETTRGRNPEVDVPYLNNAKPKGDNNPPEKLKEFFQYYEGRNPAPLPRPDELQRPREEDYWLVDY